METGDAVVKERGGRKDGEREEVVKKEGDGKDAGVKAGRKNIWKGRSPRREKGNIVKQCKRGRQGKKGEEDGEARSRMWGREG